MKKSWSVAVLFEDNATRKEAQDFFDRLAADYWSETEFKLEWSSFESLADDLGFREQAKRFAKADLLIFANGPHRPLPFHVHQWGEEWLRLRGRREGVLVAVSEPLTPAWKVRTPCVFEAISAQSRHGLHDRCSAQLGRDDS
jgi:hypothetical protein